MLTRPRSCLLNVSLVAHRVGWEEGKRGIEIIPPITPCSRRHRLRDEDYWDKVGRFNTKCVIYLQEFFIYKYSTPQKLDTPWLLTALKKWVQIVMSVDDTTVYVTRQFNSHVLER